MLYDTIGRRVFKSEDQAFKAQKRAMLYHGICSAIVRRSDGMYVLLFDPQAEI